MADSQEHVGRPGSLRIMSLKKRLSALQDRLEELSREALEKIPEDSIIDNAFWRWTIGSNLYELDNFDECLDLGDWSDAELEHLDQQLRDGGVHVEIVDRGEIKTLPNSANGLESNSSKSQKRYRLPERLRDRLIQTIETAIGRPILQRTSKPIDPRQSDPDPPNLYTWRFSQEYPNFPTKRGGISRWTAEQIRQCNEALDKGYLSIGVVEPGSAEQEMRNQRNMGVVTEEEVNNSPDYSHSDQDNERGQSQYAPPNSPSSVARLQENENSSPHPENADLDESNGRSSAPISAMKQRFKEETERIYDEAKTSDELMNGFSEVHDMLREHRTRELKQTLKSKYEIKMNKLKEQKEELEARLRAEQGSKHDAVAMASEYQMQVNSLKEEAARHADELCERIASARQEGENAGRKKAIEDLNAVNEGERLAYLTQLDKVTKDSYQQGFDAGRAFSKARSSEIEELKRVHLEEVNSAREAGREAGRQEGRDMAFKEMALGPEDQITNLVQGHNELNTSRKVRELKTIHQNWGEPPQKALPSWMLPEGHTPGDKTLYFLAKLSKEVDGSRASQLLTEEIDRRCLNVPKDSKNRIVTNTDIKNVIDAIQPPNSSGHAASIESSVTPQPQSQQSSRREATSAKSTIPNHKSSKVSTISQVGRSESSLQGQPTPASSGNIHHVMKIYGKHQQLQTPTPSRPNGSTPTIASHPKQQSIEQILRSLPSAPRINLESALQVFSSKFIQKHVGGAEYTFATVSPDNKDQTVPWRAVIRVNTVLHRYAPRLGVHGALTLVQGKPNNGIIGNIEPVILKTDTDKYSYLGHYTVVSRHAMPVSAWMNEADETRIRIARELADTKWGEQLLKNRNVKIDGATLQDRIDQILASFEAENNQPNLRAEWLVLQLSTFKHDDYNRLLTAMGGESPSGAGRDLQFITATTMQQNIIEWSEKRLISTPRFQEVDFAAAEANGLTARIIEKAEADQKFGISYETPNRRKVLQHYLVQLILHINDSFPLISVPSPSEIARAFNCIYAIFTRHNDKFREKIEAERRERRAKRGIGALQNQRLSSVTSFSFSSSSASAPQKRQHIGSEPQPSKRPKTVPRTSIPQVMLKFWEKNTDGLLVEEPNGSMIIVDTNGSVEPEVKHDMNEVEEDLYNATPAPKGNRMKKLVDA